MLIVSSAREKERFAWVHQAGCCMGQEQLVYGCKGKGAPLHGNVVNSLCASAHSFQRAALACCFQRHLQREQTPQLHTEEQNPSRRNNAC